MLLPLRRIAHRNDHFIGSFMWLISHVFLVTFCGLAACYSTAMAADPAIVFMDRVAKESILASRSRSPAALQAVISRYADAGQIGLYALGDYRSRLEPGDREAYTSGMVRFIGRYAATESPKYPVARVTFNPEVRQTRAGIMVDSSIIMQDGTSHEVAWLLTKYGTNYRIRDAQVLSFWLTSFLKKLFEDYIGQNNGSVKALVQVLQRH
jgi:phospholipid transport system substrate-binding protein